MTEQDVQEKVLELKLDKYTELEKVLQDPELAKDDDVLSNYSEIQQLEAKEKAINELLGSTDPKVKAILENAGIEIEQFATGKHDNNSKNNDEIFNINLKLNGVVIATWSQENGVWIHGGHAGIGFESIVRRIENIRNEMNTLEQATAVARYQYALRELRELDGKDGLSIPERLRRRNVKRKVEKLSVDPEVSRYLDLQKKNPNLTQEAVDNLKKTCEDLKIVGRENMSAEEMKKAIEKKLKDNKKELLSKSVGKGYFEVLETYRSYKEREDLKGLSKSVKEMVLESLPARGYESLRKDFDRYDNAYSMAAELAKNDNKNFSMLDARARLNYFRFALEMQRILDLGLPRDHIDPISREIYEARMRIFRHKGRHPRPFAKVGMDMKRDMMKMYVVAQTFTASISKTNVHIQSRTMVMSLTK